MYNGIINPRNETDIEAIHLGLLSSSAFDLKTLSKVGEKEDNLVGKSIQKVSDNYIDYVRQLLINKYGYEKEFELNREAILKGILYYEDLLEVKQVDLESELKKESDSFQKRFRKIFFRK